MSHVWCPESSTFVTSSIQHTHPRVPFIFTARKRSLRRLCFYTCLSVILFTGGWSAPVHAGMHTPRSRYPPRSSSCWEIRATSGRYASYWNAYLFKLYFCELICGFLVTEKNKREMRFNPHIKQNAQIGPKYSLYGASKTVAL